MPRDMDRLHVGQLRWLVTLATQEQLPDPSSPAEVTSFVNPVQVWAKIDPISSAQFLLNVQTEYGQITHEIVIRATGDYPAKFTYVLRDILRNDGSSKTEVFRIHRSLEIDGRQRFLKLDAEIISSGNVVNQYG